MKRLPALWGAKLGSADYYHSLRPMTKIVDYLIGIVCLTTAGAGATLFAFLCRSVSQFAVKNVIPKSGSEQLPALTQIWAVGIAHGTFPLITVAFFVSLLIEFAGLYVIFSKRASVNARSNSVIILCCVGFAFALVITFTTLLAVVLPFLQTTKEL